MAYKMEPIKAIITDLGLNDKGDVHRFFTQTCAIHCDKYVPYDEGTLSLYTLEANKIIYEQEYAQYQYYGMREDGTHVINEANRNRTMHPLATSYWDKQMWNAESQDVINEVENYIGRKL